MATTIQIKENLKKMLEGLKVHPRESYSSVIERLIESRIDAEPLSKEAIKNIEKALRDIKSGKVYSTSEVKKKLGIR